jgi:hypothetical protein
VLELAKPLVKEAFGRCAITHMSSARPFGECNAIVEAEDWEGQRFQTCVNAAIVKAFPEIFRRRVGQRPLNRGRGGRGFVPINPAYAE